MSMENPYKTHNHVCVCVWLRAVIFNLILYRLSYISFSMYLISDLTMYA